MLDFLRTANPERNPVIISFNLILRNGDLPDSDALSASLLDQEANAGNLVEDSQFGLVILGAAARENSMAFDEDLSDIGNHASRVPERVALEDPIVDEFPVLHILGSRPQIAGAENVGLLLDHAMLVGEDPLAIDLGQLLHFVHFRVVEDDGCARAVDGQDCIHLGVQLLADQLVLIVWPD